MNKPPVTALPQRAELKVLMYQDNELAAVLHTSSNTLLIGHRLRSNDLADFEAKALRTKQGEVVTLRATSYLLLTWEYVKSESILNETELRNLRDKVRNSGVDKMLRIRGGQLPSFIHPIDCPTYTDPKLI